MITLPKIDFAKRLVTLMLSMTMGTALMAQPGNPTYSLSTNTFFEIDMRSIALFDLETNQATTNFSMQVPTPTEAGAGLMADPVASHSHNWLNYSCAARNVISRKVQVNISSGSLPTGFELRVISSSASGSGAGALGSPVVAPVVLDATPKDIITGIRGAYTGDGPYNGHQLNYTLHFVGSSFSVLQNESPSITITYTLIDN